MLKVVKSTDYELLSSFMKGEGVIRRCAGGYDTQGLDMKEVISSYPGMFLLALEDEKPWGFITLNRMLDDVYSIHLCLRTIGEKTRVFFQLALDYAKEVLGAKEIRASYPTSYRAVEILIREFNFEHEGIMTTTPVPYSLNSLKL